ncbi:hypothetical protein K440DRAFT_657605 [Wilcoxina mikolae CBS 423.85]|nr:hypothetical protein K440DRAFT_657605 [Wilcoxina mikolae CBS 423.85]
MSRKTIHFTSTNSSFSHSMPALPRDSSPSPAESSHHHGRHSLVDNVPSEPKGLNGREPTKQGGMGKSLLNGGTEGQCNDQSSAESGQDDEDDDDDDDDEDDGEKPAVASPARAESNMPEVQTMNSDQCLLAGPNKKRTYDDANLGDEPPVDVSSVRDDEEPDYPRKKIPRHISATTQGILAYSEPRFMHDDQTDDKIEADDDDAYEMIGDDDDGNITEEEEAAILHEFETDEDILREIGLLEPSTTTPAELDGMADIFDNGLFDDLDGEIFDAMCNDPHRFDDLQTQSALDWNPFTAESGDDLFSVHPTPRASPDSTPRASVSEPEQAPRSHRGSFTSEDDQDGDTSEDEMPNLSPFFEMGTAALKHLVSTEGKGGWSDETDDDADLLKYFFSSAEDDSAEESGSNDDEDDEDTQYDGDTTDEEEDLPMPTPRNASKLRRASVSSTAARPQIVDTNHEGPELCSWVADPSRPICVIEGTKQTFLIPGTYPRFSVGESESAASDIWIPMEGESESEQSTIPASFDPTLTGLIGMDDGMLNGSDILGPSEAFFAFKSENGDIFSDIFNEDDYDVDEFEAGLEIDDFLDLSSDEEGVSEASKNIPEGMSDDCGEDCEDEEDECIPNGDSSADMLSIWDKVSVTAFRKRQIQHNQKQLSALHAAGYHKGKEGRLSDTITPSKKRRVRQKFLASNRGGMGNNPVGRKKPAR